MTIRTKKYVPDQDFDRVLDFLRDTYLETQSLANYFPNIFENDKNNYPDGICIWEEVDLAGKAKIVGLTTPERKFLYFIQIHPYFHDLLSDMVEWILNHSKNVKDIKNLPQDLIIVCLDGYITLEDVLERKGFERVSNYGYLRFRDVNEPIHEYTIPKGFSVRSIKGEEEFELYAIAIRNTFGHGEFFNSELVKEINSNSYYKQDLDLIVEAPNGDIAAFCTFRMDPKSKITELEPMGTLSMYRKLGLGKAILAEGYKRLKKYKPSLLYIGGAADTPEANKLYDSTGFTEKTKLFIRKKEI